MRRRGEGERELRRVAVGGCSGFRSSGNCKFGFRERVLFFILPPPPAASQMGGVYDVVEISMISRGMTVQSLVIRSLDDIIHAISRVRYPVRVRYRSRDILHCGDVAAAISGLGEGYLCCVLYVFIPLIYDFRNETSDIKGASHSTDSQPNTR